MKTYKTFEVRRNGSNNPAEVTAVTDIGFVYHFSVAPELTDRQILRLVGRLIDHANQGTRRGRKKEAV